MTIPLILLSGWPKELDYTEPLDVAKYQKKMLRETNLGYALATKDLVQNAEKSIK